MTEQPPTASSSPLHRTAVHEAGHAVTARLLGREVDGVTIVANPGREYSGLTVWGPAPETPSPRPFHEHPAEVLADVDTALLIAAAGEVAADLACLTTGRSSSVHDRLAGTRRHLAIEWRRATPERSSELRDVLDPPTRGGAPTPPAASDLEKLWELAMAVNDADPRAARLHLNWITARTTALLIEHAPAVEFVAAQLVHGRDLNACEAAQVLDTALALTLPPRQGAAS